MSLNDATPASLALLAYLAQKSEILYSNQKAHTVRKSVILRSSKTTNILKSSANGMGERSLIP